jgi:hypothetical protein
MRRRMPTRRADRGLAGASLASLALAACVPRAVPPAPIPAPAPVAAPMPPPPPPRPAPEQTDWQTGPLSPGDWTYRVVAGLPTASFGPLTIRCSREHDVQISLLGPQGVAIVVRTSFGELRLPGNPDHFQSYASLPASDPLLDQMAFSRGRLLVTAEGGASLVVPAWPELARVIEDCRAP